MIFVDTGYWIALFDDRDELHPRALAWAASVTGPLVSTHLVLVETVNYLTTRMERGRLHILLDRVVANGVAEFVPAAPELLRAGLALHRSRPDKDWSLTDCLSFVLMNERSITDALAHDHHFEQAGFTALLRSDP
jgi:predicted nucleic acid-binding protein